MSHKERYLTAVRRQVPDLVPVDASFMDMIHVERITGKKTYATGGGGGGGGIALRPEEADLDLNEIMLRNQKLLNEAMKGVGFDSLVVSDYWLYPRGFKLKFIDGNTYVDQWGKIYRIRADVRITYWIGGTIKSEEDLDRYEPPNPDEISYEIVDETVKEAGDEYPVIGWCHCGEMFSYLLRGGIDQLVLDIYRRPEFAKKLIKTISETNIEIAKRVMDRGVSMIVDSDDVADSRGTFYPPKIFREFFFPYTKKLVDECHRRGVPFMRHSDGNLYPIMDDLVALGINGLHPIEPGAMDLADMKKRYGDRIFLRGNVDCGQILSFGSTDDVRRDVRRCIDAAAEGGGFILADSNSLHSNVKTENIFAMIDEGRTYGRYPLVRR